jgi:PPOX class probable F420-dependent enzyme
MEVPSMRRRFGQARVARLATVGPGGQPHLVPVCFSLDGDRIVTAVDRKPKSTTALRRLDNVRAHPAVSLLVDQYDEDWTQLWWIRADGDGRVLEAGPELDLLLEPLHEKYRDKYGLHPPEGPAIVVDVHHWVGWSATEPQTPASTS